MKPAILRTDRKDRRLFKNKSGKRTFVVVGREIGGSNLPAVFKTEGQAVKFIKQRVAKGTIINADEANS